MNEVPAAIVVATCSACEEQTDLRAGNQHVSAAHGEAGAERRHTGGAHILVATGVPKLKHLRGVRLKQHHCGAFGQWVRDLAHWQAFGTMTFEREVSVWGAWRSFEDFVVRQIPWVKAFYSVERHRVHGGHLHALFAECGELEWRHGARGRMLVASMNV